MQISYLGYSSFRIKTENINIVTDPYSYSIGWHFPKQEAQIVTISQIANDDCNNKEGIRNEDAFIIDGPGEYEIKDIMVRGMETVYEEPEGKKDKNIVFVIESEDIKICHLGFFRGGLTSEQIKEIEGSDVLMIPIGGVDTIDVKKAKELVKKIDPSYVIPMQYKQPGLSETHANLANLEEFLEEMAVESEEQDKLKISSMNVSDETEVVVLNRRK
jgi:L-ascorbate metabolism protein UlaG (beta-lactamase superfamily)